MQTSTRYGRLGLAADMPTTAPTATQAPTINPTRMRNDLDRFCFAGATTAPAGLEAATPVGFSYGAAAVPTGFEVPFCCCCGAGGNVADDCS